ncbi:TPA: hypothetical protein ACJTPC_003625 [Providencia alcalifaciens]
MSGFDEIVSCTWCREMKPLHDMSCINGYFICPECMEISTARKELRNATRGEDSLDEEDDNNSMVWDEDLEEWVYPEDDR